MVIIKVNAEDKDNTLKILLGNGRFRSLGENQFDVIDHSEAVVQKLKASGIVVQDAEIIA